MTQAKAKPEAPEVEQEAVSGDAGAAELQARADEALSKGYLGTVPDTHPNEAYSLASGPDSPSAASANPATAGKLKEATRG